MRWTRVGAQAMLNVRSEYLNGDWERFQEYRIETETQQLYPDRAIIQRLEWHLAI